MLVAPPYQRDQPHQRFLKVEQFNRYMDRRDNENLAQMEAADIRATVLKIKKFAPNDFQVVYQDYQWATYVNSRPKTSISRQARAPSDRS